MRDEGKKKRPWGHHVLQVLFTEWRWQAAALALDVMLQGFTGNAYHPSLRNQNLVL